MIYFQCDYAEGCHPKILEALAETNYTQTPGYGVDDICSTARDTVRRVCGTPDADVHFLVGGTQANATVVAHVLRPWQGVICADTGHLNGHETGAVEARGHKLLILPNVDGKLTAQQIGDRCAAHFNDPALEHVVQPGMAYISFPTESGTLYSKAELQEIYAVCRQWNIPLFIDGARLGYGLMSPVCDVTIQELAQLCDVFYIGGTKCGAMFGEAVVINNESIKKDFRYSIKQNGGMLAKGRLLGIQFETLLADGLYFDICRQAIDYAMEIREAFQAKGVTMYGTSMTNQQFPLLTKAQLAVFDGRFAYEYWGEYDEQYTIVRFCTSWATKRENVDALLAAIAEL